MTLALVHRNRRVLQTIGRVVGCPQRDVVNRPQEAFTNAAPLQLNLVLVGGELSFPLSRL